MKTFILLSFLLTIFELKAAITYDTREFKLKGKNYNAKNDSPKYGYYIDVSTDKLTLLYLRTKNNKILFIGFWISKPLAARLPMVVIRYIGKYIADVKLRETKSIDEAMKVTQQAVNKALDKKWLNSLTHNSVSFSDMPVYKRDHAGFDMNYYEFLPLEKNNLTNPTILHDTTILKVYTDSIISIHKVILEKGKILSEVKDNLLKKPDFDKTVTWQKYRYDNLMDVVTKLRSLSYHHEKLRVSDWPLASTKMFKLHDSAPSGFHTDVDSICKYLMVLQLTLKKEQLMPTMAWKQNYGDWKATRCNMFAGDFAQQTLGLSTYPWGTKDWRAHEIHDNLPNNMDFVTITWGKAWEYAKMGYPVFITAPKYGSAGHIAIAYPVSMSITNVTEALENGKIVQAGSDNGMMLLKQGFSVTKNFEKETKVYVYLGYLKAI